MTRQQHRNDLHAQQRFLRERLQSIPATAQLTRNSIADRLEALDEELALLPEDARPLARARLTFDGRPVIGTQGVFADFGAKAIGRFSDAIATVAASLTAPLAAMGPIPGREQNQVLITNVALGSFGFELEEHNQGQIDLDNKTPVALALERTQRLLPLPTPPPTWTRVRWTRCAASSRRWPTTTLSAACTWVIMRFGSLIRGRCGAASNA
jgi:hypothetical protein